MASKKKVALGDYEMTTTLGTGKLGYLLTAIRVFWKSQTC